MSPSCLEVSDSGVPIPDQPLLLLKKTGYYYREVYPFLLFWLRPPVFRGAGHKFTYLKHLPFLFQIHIGLADSYFFWLRPSLFWAAWSWSFFSKLTLNNTYSEGRYIYFFGCVHLEPDSGLPTQTTPPSPIKSWHYHRRFGGFLHFWLRPSWF